MQRRLDEHPAKMRQQRETVEHLIPSARSRRAWARPPSDEDVPRVASEIALHVLAHNLTRVMNVMGVQPLLVAMWA
jgi:hypothetical protein